MTKQQAYDSVTADFISKVVTAMPTMPGSVMQEWKPAELSRALMRAVAAGPKGNHVPRFPIAHLHPAMYRKTREELLELYGWSHCGQMFRSDTYIQRIMDEAFSGPAPKAVKRSRRFFGVFAEFIPEELRIFIRDNQYIPRGLFQWAQEVGLRPMTQYDALHLAAALPGKSSWYGERSLIVPMFVPTPARALDKKQAYTAWHADMLASMLRIEPYNTGKLFKNHTRGETARSICANLPEPDTIMVFWA